MNELIEKNMYQLGTIVNEFHGFTSKFPLAKEEMIESGMEAMIRYSDNYDPNKSSDKTYFNMVIRRSMQNYIRDFNNTIESNTYYIDDEDRIEDFTKSVDEEFMFKEDEVELIQHAKNSGIKDMDKIVELILKDKRVNDIVKTIDSNRMTYRRRLIRFGKYLKNINYFSHNVTFD